MMKVRQLQAPPPGPAPRSAHPGAPAGSRTAAAILIGAWLLGLLAAPVTASEDLNSDEVGLLYSPQVQFGPQGIPLVTIGLMEQRDEVTISSTDGLVISGRQRVVDQWVDKVLRLPADQRLLLQVVDAVPALVSYWCGVASLPFAERERLDRVVALWRSRGHAVQVFEVGSVFGIRGHVIDNRTYILGLRAFATEAEAERFGQILFDRWGTRTFAHAHLDRRPSGRIRLLDDAGQPLDELVDLVRIRSDGPAPVRVHQVEHGRGYDWHGFEDRRYAGGILVSLDRGGQLVVVNRIRVDRLLEGLVPAEIFTAAPMDALEAQAVVARGEVFAKLGTRHFLDPYLLCAATHCQVYSGVEAEHPRTSRAVRATRGELLFHGEKLVDSVYSACCGGHTEDNDAVWSHPPSPALRGRADLPPDRRARWQDVRGRLKAWLESTPPAFCQRSSFARADLFRWERTIDSEKMDALVNAVEPVGHVVAVQVLARGVSGRVKGVRVVGTEGELVVQREWPVRQLLGMLRSGMFLVEPLLDDEQLVRGFHFTGGGWGHGVGMCQIGATGMAEQGYDYRQILAHYYGGARVYRLYGPRAGEPVEPPLRFIAPPDTASAP